MQRTLKVRRRVAISLLAALAASGVVAIDDAYAARPTCGGRIATIVGTKRSDKIVATRRADVIVAKGGADVIDGRGGKDLICAGPGNDVVRGGSGDDLIWGGRGADELRGGRGNDVLWGGRGNDALRGGRGADRLYGGPGIDRCFGGTTTACEGGGGDGGDPGPGRWETGLARSGPDRHEVSFVAADGSVYLAGGRNTAHEVYDPGRDSWSTARTFPESLDHVQAVEVGGKIYYLGGLTGWPQPHSSKVYIYDPVTDTFSTGANMPRGRGAGGVAVFRGKIYYAGGLHDGQTVAWFDVYDPFADNWTQLPDMPRARDHFHAAVVDGKFYAIGGRRSDVGFNALITANDAYEFSANRWRTGLAPLPTARAGFATAVVGDDIVIIGGEGGGRAHDEVEAYDTSTDTWRRLAPMPTARHGIQAAIHNGVVYVAAGGTRQGGGGATDVLEAFHP